MKKISISPERHDKFQYNFWERLYLMLLLSLVKNNWALCSLFNAFLIKEHRFLFENNG